MKKELTNQKKAEIIHGFFHTNGTGYYNPTEGLALCRAYAETEEGAWLKELMIQEGFMRAVKTRFANAA